MEATDHDQYVIIELGLEKYAILISEIYEIIKMQKITQVSGVRTYLEGVTNLRGKIVPVISLRRRFQLEDRRWDKRTRIVIVKCKEEFIGIVIDGVSQVRKFAEIQPATEIVTGIDSAYFTGIGLSEEGLISILNINEVLAG
jgi:purine-binding chemotaxis protein CheW